MPLAGVNKVCLFSACNNATTPPPANLTVPVSVVGKGGSVFVATLVNLTAFGAPWTTGTAVIGSGMAAVMQRGFITKMMTVMIPPTPMGMTTTMVPNTTQPGGQPGTAIRLVTPVFVSTNIGASAVVPVFSILDFVVATPEPEVAAGLAAVIGTLVVLGRSRLHRR